MSDRLTDIMGRVPDSKPADKPGDKPQEEVKLGPDGKPIKSPLTHGPEWDLWKDKYREKPKG